MKLVIIDYEAGNTQSVLYAIERLGCQAQLTDDPEEITKADGVIFPGVGHAVHAMNTLQSKGLDKLIPGLKQPVLGICLGMQLLAKQTEEGNCSGLGIINEKVKEFSTKVKVPHVGWNEVENLKGSLFRGVQNGEHFYYVHGYFLPNCEVTTGSTNYDVPITAALEKDNYFGCQFHPEKSGKAGEQILKNFIELCE